VRGNARTWRPCQCQGRGKKEELRGLEPLAFWMQTTGAALLAVSRCSPPYVRTLAQGSRGAHGLLYLAAVQTDWRHQGHRQEAVDADPSLVMARAMRPIPSLTWEVGSHVSLDQLEPYAVWIDSSGQYLRLHPRKAKCTEEVTCQKAHPSNLNIGITYSSKDVATLLVVGEEK
jgi:hypothetical protein